MEDQESADFVCKLQAFFINYGELSSILWTTVIAWLLYQQIIVQRIADVKQYELKMFVYAYAVPLFFSFHTCNQWRLWKSRGMVLDKIRLKMKWKSQLLRLVEFYLPLWIAFIFNGICIYKVVKFVNERAKDKQERKLVNKLKYYPLILVFCWSIATVDRILNFAGIESIELHIINITLAGLQGFLNACVYGFSKKVQNVLKERFPCIQKCPCIKQKQHNFEENKTNEKDELNNDSLNKPKKKTSEELEKEEMNKEIEMQIQKQQN